MVNRILKVQGTGIVEEKPDILYLNFNVQNKEYTYEEAMSKVNIRTNELKKNLSEVGIQKSDVKTSSYNIDTTYRRVNDKNIFDGYRCTHNLEVELPVDSELIRKAIEKIVSSGIDVPFSMNFSVKDKEAMRKKVIENGVKDALSKAEIISKAAGVRLGNIISISHGWNEVRFYHNNNIDIDRMALKCEAMPDITPRDIKASDYVNVEWEIE
ncbi:MAG TPA: SIMPL domain-containing protein [Candidatus Methanofastidiosum sp.]|nr:SIMPL domain-containing protein [Methanofastidiosum sp.]